MILQDEGILVGKFTIDVMEIYMGCQTDVNEIVVDYPNVFIFH